MVPLTPAPVWELVRGRTHLQKIAQFGILNPSVMPHLNQGSFIPDFCFRFFTQTPCIVGEIWLSESVLWPEISKGFVFQSVLLVYTCCLTASCDENGNSETEIYINKLVLSFCGTLVQGPIYLSWEFVEPEGLNTMRVKSFTHFYDRFIWVRNS